MKTLRLAILPLLLAALGGCASGPYYYGGTSYRMHNIGGLPVSSPRKPLNSSISLACPRRYARSVSSAARIRPARRTARTKSRSSGTRSRSRTSGHTR